MWTQAHVGSWELALVLGIVSYFLYRFHQEKVAKILHMIVRLAFVIVVVTGGYMLFVFSPAGIFHLKALLALIGISLMEMALIRAKKDEPGLAFFLSSLVVLVVVILIGYGVIG